MSSFSSVCLSLSSISNNCRVQQAKSLCTDRANCQFGYTFDGQLRESVGPGGEGGNFREIVFIPPTSPPDTGDNKGQNNLITRPQTDNQNTSPTAKPSRRRLRLNIDPRRRSQDRRVDTTTEPPKVRSPSNKARGGKVPTPPQRKKPPPAPEHPRSFDLFEPPFPEDDNTVTINIGGTPIVIPDFDLSPQQKQISAVTKSRVSATTTKPSRQLAQNQRRNRNQQMAKNQRRQGQRNKQTSKQTTVPPTTRQRTTQRTLPPNTFSTTLTSFNSLLTERESFRSFNNFTPAPQPVIKTPSNQIAANKRKQGPRRNSQSVRKQIPTTTQRTIKITPKRRNQPKKGKNKTQNRVKTPRRPSPKPNNSSKSGLKTCPGTLEDCVDTCVPLEDIYAYSACVVECGERC